MPQINLLSNEAKQSHVPWELVLTLLTRLLLVAFIAMLGYYGFAYFASKSTDTKIAQKQQDILALQNEIVNAPGRKELLVRQAQLAEANKLLKGHLYWSKFLPELAKVTLKSASYLSLGADNKGTARITVAVPGYTEFDKFLQVFDSPEFNKHFSDVRVLSVSKYQVDDITGVKFDVELKFNNAFLTQS